jgi:hypothetical protein
MRPDVVTFWHGPLDALRLTCLRSQVAAGHRVTIYSFEPLGQLPDGVGNAEAEAILPHRLTFFLRQLQGGSKRLSDIRVAIYGPAALTALARRAGELRQALPKKSFYAVHAEPKLFFEPHDFSALIGDPDIIGLHLSPKGRGSKPPVAGSLYAWAAERFGGR